MLASNREILILAVNKYIKDTNGEICDKCRELMTLTPPDNHASFDW